ncbi:M56 family metallopeptidase [Intestinimonas massiliensis (ex Afouda et al. 2020)]|uniref:M56 family metallopeptidase n=1 Tax=Intestinimonas massiliensis (ex Afouda et al. 2020) TaxID=1673721 RepID=UPI001030B876|nr:M56 family metallopeptidase [Intestinimonas massiliensis (ex Afouda et al. 2020)]
MPHLLFSAVLRMSAAASGAILVVLLARQLLKRVPKIFSYALWAVVLFRLLCPAALPFGFSPMDLFPDPVPETGTVERVDLPDGEHQTATIHVGQQPEQTGSPALEQETPAVSAAQRLMSIAGILWLCGVGAMLVFHLAQLLRLRRRLTGAVPVEGNVYLADHIPTPFVLGLFRPRIYLPSTVSERERPYILRHETHHIRRGDHITRLLAFGALCLHWFNPLVWLAFRLSARDMEMSCDEAVLRGTRDDIRADYSASLLQFAAGKRRFIRAPLAFGEGDTRERIENIMKYKRPTWLAVVLAALLCVSLTACLSSGPKPDASQAPDETYAMTDEDFAAYTGNPIGAVMADLDYADGEKLVFHYSNGFFVLDLKSYELTQRIDLSKLDLAHHGQGDTVLSVQVDREGNYAYLSSQGTEAGDFAAYRIDLDSGAVEQGEMPADTELFTDFADISSIPVLEGWCSDRGIRTGDGACYYLITQGGMVGGIKLVVLPAGDAARAEIHGVFGQQAAPAQLTVAPATEELLARYPAYDEIDASIDEYGNRLLLTTDQTVKDLTLFRLTWDEETQTRVTAPGEALYHTAEFTPDRPLVVSVSFPGILPTVGLSFTDTDGRQRTFQFDMSGKDGSFLLVEE